jgi:hypothetical protein
MMKNTMLEIHGRSTRASASRLAGSLYHFLLTVILTGAAAIANAGTPLEQETTVSGQLFAGAYHGRPLGHARLMKRRHAQNVSVAPGTNAGNVSGDDTKQSGIRASCRSKRSLCNRFGKSRSVNAMQAQSHREAAPRGCRQLRYRPRPMRHRC